MRSQLSWVLSICLLAPISLAQTTRPGGGRTLHFEERIHDLMGQLDLTEDQKQKIDDIIQQAKDQFQKELPALRDATPEQRRAKVQEIFVGVRQEIGDLLTPEQKRKLQELIQKQRKAQIATTQNAPERPNRVAGLFRRRNVSAPATRPGAPIKDEAMAAPIGKAVDVGQRAPDVPLHWMNGDALHLSIFKGKVVVLIFGSYTTPTFRDKAPAIPNIAERYEGRAKILIVYTKEAHPSDGWVVERNQREDIDIAQPTDMAGRRAEAQQAIDSLHLAGVPIALDSMNDAAATVFNAFPDGVVVIGKDGKIVARQHWLDPTELPALIDQALKK